jgi:hypothetical protein
MKRDMGGRPNSSSDEMGSMGKGTLCYGEREMATEKAQGKPESFSILGIGSSMMYSYISGSTSLTTSD